MFVCIKLFIVVSYYYSFNICKIWSDNFIFTLVHSNLCSFSLFSENLARSILLTSSKNWTLIIFFFLLIVFLTFLFYLIFLIFTISFILFVLFPFLLLKLEPQVVNFRFIFFSNVHPVREINFP